MSEKKEREIHTRTLSPLHCRFCVQMLKFGHEIISWQRESIEMHELAEKLSSALTHCEQERVVKLGKINRGIVDGSRTDIKQTQINLISSNHKHVWFHFAPNGRFQIHWIFSGYEYFDKTAIFVRK